MKIKSSFWEGGPTKTKAFLSKAGLTKPSPPLPKGGLQGGLSCRPCGEEAWEPNLAPWAGGFLRHALRKFYDVR